MTLGSIPLLAQLGLIVVLVALFIARRWRRAASRDWAASPASSVAEPGRPAFAASGGEAGRAGFASSGKPDPTFPVPDELLPLAFADTCAGWTQLGDVDIALDIAPAAAANEIAWDWDLNGQAGLGTAVSKSCTMSHQAPLYA